MNWLAEFRKRLLTGIADFTCRHPLPVVAFSVLLTALSVVGIFRLDLETSIADYLPADSEVVHRFTRAVEHYGSSDHLVILLRGDEEDTEIRKALADDLAQQLLDSGLALSAEYRFGNDTGNGGSSPILDYALLYLDDPGLERFADMLSTEAIEARVEANLEILRSPASLVAKELVTRDPLGLRDLFAGRFRELKGNLNLRFMDGYAFSQELDLLVMLVKPSEPAQDLQFTEALLVRVRGMVERAKRALAADLGEEAVAGIEVGLTGGYPIVSEYNALLKKDLGWSIGTAFIGVMILFLLAFRRIGSLLYVGLPLVITVMWTMGFAGFAVGHLNLFTGAAAAVLMGLAIDFAIHLFNRYVSERDRGVGLDEAIHLAVVETGDGVLTAALTTVVAFGACTVAGIQGLSDLGIICGAGMVFGLVSNFMLMPAFLKLRGGRQHRDQYSDSSFNFGLASVAQFVTRRPWWVMGAWALLASAFVWGSLNTTVDTDMHSLRPDASPAIQLQREIASRIGSSLVYSMILIQDDSEEAALEKNSRVARNLDRLVKQGDVVFYLSLASVIPSRERQLQVMDWLAEKRRADPARLDVERISADLADAMRRSGFRVGQTHEDTVDLLRRATSLEEVLTLDSLDDPGVRARTDRFVWRGDGKTELVTYVYPDRDPSSGEQYAVTNRLEEEVLAGIDGAHLIGVKVLGRELKRLIRDGTLEAALLAFVLVVLLLWSHFRKLRLVVMTAVPLILGELGAVGGMALLGINLNMVNMGIVPIILGIGIDDGIHIVHRFVDRGSRDVVEVFHFAGRAVVITSLTTIVGFGSLVFASYRGLWTAGLFAIIGVGMCLLSSVTLLPAMLQVFGHVREPRKTPASLAAEAGTGD